FRRPPPPASAKSPAAHPSPARTSMTAVEPESSPRTTWSPLLPGREIHVTDVWTSHSAAPFRLPDRKRKNDKGEPHERASGRLRQHPCGRGPEALGLGE